MDTVIATGAGTAWNLILSDGTILPLAGSCIDVSGNGNHGENDGVDLLATQDEYHYNLLNGWGEGNNIIVNGDFEDGTTSWSVANATIATEYDAIRESNVAKVTTDGSAYCGASQPGLSIPAVSNISGWAKAPAGTSIQIYTVYSGYEKLCDGTGDWVYFSKTLQFNDGYYQCALRIFPIAQPAGTEFWLDDIAIQEMYIPRLADDSGWADTVATEHTAGYWHNGAETGGIVGATTHDGTGWNVDSAVKAADTEEILHDSGTGYGIPLGYDDLQAVFTGDYLFCDVTTENGYKKLLLYNAALTGTALKRAKRYVGDTP